MEHSQTSPIESADVVIVGAGMVGLAAALAIAESQLRVIVLEAQPAPSESPLETVAELPGFDPRVSALTCASQQFLKYLGVWKHMQALRVSPYSDMDVWDGEGSGRVHFSAAELHEPELGHIVENRVTVAALTEALKQRDNVELWSDAALKGVSEWQPKEQARQLTLADGRVISCQLLVAADGANSHCRRMAGIPMTEWDYGHHAIVTTVETEQSNQQTAWQCFTGDGPLAFLPLSSEQGHFSSIVWSTSPDHARDLMAQDDNEFCAALEMAFEHRLGKVIATDRRFVFPLRQRHAKYYVKTGLAVIGDAAHTIHPLAGQGVNLGLLDAAVLAEVVIDAVGRGEDYSAERCLRKFQRRRQRDNLQMSAAMEGFKRLFDSENATVKLLRNTGMNLFDRIAPVKQHLVMQAMGLSGDLPRLCRRQD